MVHSLDGINKVIENVHTFIFLFIYPLVLNKLKKEIKTWKKTICNWNQYPYSFLQRKSEKLTYK